MLQYDENGKLLDVDAQDRRDAARYRWLREGDNDETLLKFSLEARCGTDDVWLMRTVELDAAIDAAMRETPNVGGNRRAD